MDTSNLQKNYPLLIKFFREHGYSKDYISKFMTYIREILKLDGDPKIISYEDFYYSFSNERGYSQSKGRLRSRRNIIGIIRKFDLEGEFPYGVSRSGFLQCKNYDKLCYCFKEVIDNYRNESSKTEKRITTINGEASNASSFFLAIQDQGVWKLDAIGEENVRNVFYNGETIIRDYSYKKNISMVLKANRNYPTWERCEWILFYLPELRSRHKNFPFLSEDEVRKIKDGLAEENSDITLRDRAIITLALYTALRGTDIVALKEKDFNWNKDRIEIVQSKTGNPLLLPLRAIVGNAVSDYLLHEKTSVTTPYLFVNGMNYRKGLRSVYPAIRKFLESVGVRTEGGLKGIRLFRHHLASSLLSNGIPSGMISAILGHDSPESVNAYIDTVLEQLRECSISIEDYPVAKEVFCV
jgi:integrase